MTKNDLELTRIWRLQQMGEALAKTSDAAEQREIVNQMQLEFKPIIDRRLFVPVQELLSKKLD
jgi:hypothetical protein